MLRSARCLVLASLFIVPTVHAGMEAAPMVWAEAPTSSHGLYYFKKWTPVTIDATQVAVQGRNAEAVAAAVNAAGIDPRGAREFTIKGWWLVTVPAGTDIEKTVELLAGDARVDFATPVFVGPFGPNFPTRDVIVGFEDGVDVDQRDAILQVGAELGNGGRMLDRNWMPGVDRMTAGTRNGFEVMAQVNALAQMPSTKFAEPDMVITGKNSLIPNDTFFGSIWGIHNVGQSGGTADMDMNGPQAWDVTTGANAIITVIIDNGVDLAHPDLNLGPSHSDWTGQNGGGWPVISCDDHGTAVAGCVSARINNSLGVVGIAPGTRSASARTFISNGACDGTWTSQASWTVNAVNWAQGIGARVTNNSNGYGFTAAAIDTAYANTRAAGLVHFASSGNDGVGTIGYPASVAAVNAVGAINRNGNLTGFSQWGTGQAFAAPGQGVDTTDRQGGNGYTNSDYATVQGTSFASPYTAGVAALVLSRNPGLTAAQVENIMANTAKDRGAAGYDTVFGFGIPNAWAAVLAALPGPGNDFCSGAINVSAGGQFVGTLQNATFATSDGGASCGSSSTSPDVWYTYTAPSYAGTLRVATCGTHDTGGVDAGMDTVVAVFDSCGGTQLGCNDDWTSTNTTGCTNDAGLARDSALDVDLAPGQTVKIRVSRFSTGALGTFTMNVLYIPSNDACSSAIDLSAAAATDSGTTVNGTLVGASNDGTASCGTSSTNADVWYSFTAPSTCGQGRLRVATCGTHDAPGVDLGMDTVVSLHNACGQPSTGCNDDWTSANTTGCTGSDAGLSRDSAISQVMNPGQTVLIRVSKFSTVNPGAFTLNATYTPVNDNCADAIAVGDGVTNFCTTAATTDGPDEPGACTAFSYSHVGSDVWYRYTASCSGTATISLCGSGYDTKLAVYGGTCPSASGSVIVCNDDSCGTRSVVTFNTAMGSEYLVRVGGYQAARGAATMNITCAGGCGSSDYNGDGDFGTDADIEAFFACLAGNCCPTCWSSDFNGDGDFGTDADIEAFFRVLGGGNC